MDEIFQRTLDFSLKNNINNTTNYHIRCTLLYDRLCQKFCLKVLALSFKEILKLILLMKFPEHNKRTLVISKSMQSIYG